VNDEQKIGRITAILCDYNGIEPHRVECFGEPVFFVTVKKFDLQCIEDELKDESVSVYLAALIRSLQKIDGLIALGRPSGVWQKKI
jgi:hypothetical protein